MGESSKRGEVREGFDAHGLGGDQLDNAGVSRLDELGLVLGGLTGTTIDLLQDLLELAGNVSGVAIQDRGVSVADLSRVVQDNDLGGEAGAGRGGLVLGVGGDVATLDVLDGDVLNVESNVVTRSSFRQGLVVHLHGLDFSAQCSGGKSDDHTGLDDASLHTTDGHCSNTADLVDILEGQTKGLVSWACWGLDGVEGVQEGHARGLARLALNGPSLPLAHLLGLLQHVVSMPSRDGDEWNSSWVVADLLDDADNELLDTQGVGQQSVLTGLAILGDASLELASSRGNDQDTTIGLGGSCDHVLDEIPVSRSIDDGDKELLSVELPQSNVDGDTTLTLGLQLVQHPGVLEGTLAHLLSFLLELLDGTLVDTSALVDQVTGGGGLARVDPM